MICQEFENFGYLQEILETQYGIDSTFFNGNESTNSLYGAQGLLTLFNRSKFTLKETHCGYISSLVNFEMYPDIYSIYKNSSLEHELENVSSKYQVFSP